MGCVIRIRNSDCLMQAVEEVDFFLGDWTLFLADDDV